MIADFKNGTGWLYITEADGTTYVASYENNNQGGLSILIDGLTNNAVGGTDIYDTTNGHRYFMDATGGADPDVVSGDEITQWVTKQGLESHIPAQDILISSNEITYERQGVITQINGDTEGLIAADDLDTLTATDVIEGDIVILVGTNAARIITVKDGVDNIELANNLDYDTGDKTFRLVLQYQGGTYYEISRSPQIELSVDNLRAKNIAIPVQGVNTQALPTNGTVNVEVGVDKGYQVITGTPVLVGSVVIQPDPSPATPYLDGDTLIIDYRATPTVGVNTVTICGITLTETQAEAGLCKVTSTYKLSNTTWYSTIEYNTDSVDLVDSTELATKEDSLGNPASDGYVLSSTAGGTRSWIQNAGQVKTTSITLSSADLLDIFSTPVTIVSSTVGYIDILSVSALNLYGTAAYVGNALILQDGTSLSTIASFSAGFTTTGVDRFEKRIPSAYSDTSVGAVKYAQLTTTGSNWTTGDGTITVNIVYAITPFNN